MDGIKIEVTGNIARVIERPARITAGTVGLPVEFSFDDQWDGLSKTAVFRAGNVEKIAEDLVAETTVPWEVLENPNAWLSIGVYGVNDDGTVVIPTIWANVCVICEGVNPDGDVSTAPTLPVWQRLWNAVGNLLGLTTNAKDNLVEAINEVHNIALAGGIETDTTLTEEGKAAEARATGDEFAKVWSKMQDIDDGHVSVDGVIDIAHGGTDASTAAAALENLGAAPLINIGTYEGDIDSIDIPINSVAWITPNTVNNPRTSGYAFMETWAPKTAPRLQRLTYYSTCTITMVRMYANGGWDNWATYYANDGIIAQGTSGIWTYRKWDSGIAECWCVKKYSVTTVANGSKLLTLGDGLPFNFTETPNVHMSSRDQGAAQHWFGAVKCEKTTLNYVYVHANTAATVTGYAMIHVIGKWK